MTELLARLKAGWSNLAQREKVLVLAAGGMLALAILWVGLVLPVLGTRRGLEERVAASEQQIQVMARLRSEYDAVSARLDVIEGRIRSGSRGNLRTTLENLAQQSGVKIESMENQASPSGDGYRETKVEIALKNVTLPQIVNYLHRIESSRQVLTVKTLRMRTRSGQRGSDAPEDLLDVTFTVSSFEPI